jgi:hypothetical protein
MSKIPGIGDIPIIGLLFRSKAHQKNQSELVVMITPTIMRKGSMGVSEGLPSNVEPFLGAPNKRLPAPAPYTGSPRFPANQPAPRDPNMGDASQAVPSAPANATSSRPANGSAPPVARPAPRPDSAERTEVTKTPKANAPAIAAPPPPNTHAPAAAPAAAPAPAPRRPTKEEIDAAKRRAEDAREAEERAAKQRAEDEREKQEADREAAKRTEKERQQADKLAKERTKREAEVARKNAEIARRKAEEDARKEKAIAEAAARLKEAQAAYEAQLAKIKSGGGQ